MDVASFTLKLTTILAGMFGTGVALVRYYLHCRLQEHQMAAKIELQKENDKAKVLRHETDTFRKEVDRLDHITDTLSDRLVTCSMDLREHSARLRAIEPDLNSLKMSNPKLRAAISELHGQVAILVNDFAMARNRLKERSLVHSGGKTKLEGDKDD